VSLTFILREVKLLRELGFDIRTASINASQPSSDGFTEAEAEEQRRTFYVKPRGLARIALDHAACLASRPADYLRGLAFAARLGGTNPRSFVYHLFYFAEAIVIARWMLRNGLHHVHVHFAANTATVAMIATRIVPITYSISVHNIEAECRNPLAVSGVEQYLTDKIAGASFLCCIGQFCRSQLMRLSHPQMWNKFHIVPLGIDPEVFQPRPEPVNAEVNVVCVGRVVAEKGLPILVRAVELLAREGIRFHVHVAGDGALRHIVEEQARAGEAARFMTFHGSVNQVRVLELLSNADVFVLPSFSEGIPVALMEAMAMEIPCVSTFVGGIPELIESGVDGILVPPSDAKVLATAIGKLACDRDLRLRMGKAAREKIVRDYNLSTNIGRLAGVFTRELRQRTTADEAITAAAVM
jgi:glycosyltransferase involved in cell wall biosynthesis